MTIEAMKLALETLETADEAGFWELQKNAIAALRTAIAEAEKQEPVAWKNAAIRLGEELSSVGPDGYYNMTAEQWLDWALEQQPRGKNSLTTPPAAQRQPLTEEQIDDIWNRYCDEMGEASINDAYDIARAIEAAHGIGEKK